jgi:transcriptional regulator with XRE-family HTH domain
MGGLKTAKSSGNCAFLRYRSRVKWTAEMIKQRRQSLGWTQQDLADALGVTLRSVTSWERGEAAPRNLARLDEALADGVADRGPALKDASAVELAQELVARLQGVADVTPHQGSSDVPRKAKTPAPAGRDATPSRTGRYVMDDLPEADDGQSSDGRFSAGSN